MDERKKYIFGFLAICVALAVTLQITAFLIAFRHINGRWALPIEVAVAFVLFYWWIRRSRGRFKLNQRQLTKAARSARNLGLLYIVAPVLGYLTRGSELIALPHGLGFVLPIIPLALAVHYLRLSARLQRQSNIPETPSA